MKNQSTHESNLKSSSTIGIVVANLGTPNAAQAKAVSAYLYEFLSDPRVVELPSVLWKPLLKTVVIPKRAKAVAKKYDLIWGQRGSPLLYYTEDQASGVQTLFQQQGYDVKVACAMRYGQPSLHQVLEQFKEEGIEKVFLMPMYPQYAASTTATLLDHAYRYNQKQRNQLEIRSLKRYCHEPQYIDALKTSVLKVWEQQGQPDCLLLSFHGLPQKQVDQGDPYYDDCFHTYEQLKSALKDQSVELQYSFQSRFGPNKWLQPATDKTVADIASQGKTLDVICPGFSVDCLETLEEISVEVKDIYTQHGGKQFRYIPCLNAQDYWLDALHHIISTKISDWLEKNN